mmetsp:Transcript_10531/g.17665  ORF Transcript_10531/g.17665 Transcript_10531/m.17665 type:complete len:127 (-) Transcript_10531:428-808(-)
MGPGIPKVKESSEMDSREKFAKRDLEYPKLELIVCRKGKIKPRESDKNQQPSPEDILAYIDGREAEEPCLQLRLNNLKKGEYYVLYRPDFRPEHRVKRLNVVFYSEFQPKKSESELKKWNKELQQY